MQEGHSHWILDLPMPLSWTLQTPKSWELSIGCLRCAPVVCCYISPKWGEETVTENTSVRRRVAKRGLCGSVPPLCEMLNQAVVRTHGRKGNPETLRTFRKEYLSSRWMDASFQEISFAAFGYRFFFSSWKPCTTVFSYICAILPDKHGGITKIQGHRQIALCLSSRQPSLHNKMVQASQGSIVRNPPPHIYIHIHIYRIENTYITHTYICILYSINMWNK